jgi:guanylate kinase
MILTLSGASGTGKTTIAKALIERLPNARPLVSVTTRPPRPNDLPGDFLHVSAQAFDDMEQRAEFLWTATVGDTQYGTRRTDLQHALAHPETTWIMILVPLTVRNLRDAVAQEPGTHEVRSFYILNPADNVLRARLSERGDAPEAIDARMAACADFQEKAQASGLPFIMIPDHDDMEEKIKTILKTFFC